MTSIYSSWRCPCCGEIPRVTHRDGTPVKKCGTSGCKGNERWLTEYEWSIHQTENRKEGLYWVKLDGHDDWEVAKYYNRNGYQEWAIIGTDEPYTDDMLTIDEKRIEK